MLERRSSDLFFAFDPATLTGTVTQQATGKVWRIDLPAARGVVCGQPEPTHATFPWSQSNRALDLLVGKDGGRRLRPADVVRHRELAGGIELDVSV